jgi:hypothetical protein
MSQIHAKTGKLSLVAVPLTDPDVNLSIHPARVTAPRLPPSADVLGSSQFDPVGPSQRR